MCEDYDRRPFSIFHVLLSAMALVHTSGGIFTFRDKKLLNLISRFDFELSTKSGYNNNMSLAFNTLITCW